MADSAFVWEVTRTSGLSFSTCAELLRKGWTFNQEKNRAPWWESPATQLKKQEIPLTFNFDEKIGTIDKVEETDEGFMVTGTVDAKHAHLLGGSSFRGHIPKEGL